MSTISCPSETDAMLASALLTIRSNSLSSNLGEVSRYQTFRHETLPGLGQPQVSQDAVRSLLSATYGLSSLPAGAHGELPAAQALTSSQASTGYENFTSQPGSRNRNLTFLLPTSQEKSLPVFQNAFSLQSVGMQILQPRSTASMEQQSSLVQSSSDISAADEASCLANVRREQVEAALLSKPQRGRKRDNLSDAERLELTRTRNREHAKSTRSRKKARYQELEEKESEYKLILEERKLECERRQAVVDFLAMRERMIRKRSSTMNYETLASETEFTFDYGDVGTEHENLSGIDTMKRFDEAIISRATQCFGSDAIPLLAYSACANNVALNLSDEAIVEVNLVLSTAPNKKLMTALLTIKFNSRSNKVRSARWLTTVESFDGNSMERLSSQTSHPSVVSLERAIHVDSGASSDSASDSARLEAKHEDSDGSTDS